jgi:gentisate 1,2-dioxygenase
MAKVVTQTGLTHYEVQKKRRAASVEASRQSRSPVVIHPSDVLMLDTPRRMRTGVYMGRDGDRPTRVIDAAQHEIDPDTVTTVHRHSWDAIMFVTAGSGWTEINGRRVEWHPWDTVYLPSWAWHRHGNTGKSTAQFITWGVEPMYETFGVAVLEEAGDTPYDQLPPPPPASTPGKGGLDPYSRRMQRLASAHWEPTEYRLNTRWEDITPRVTKRGARSTFLVDSSIGYRTSGLTAVMHELGPGKWQARHRHGGEAWLHVVNGHGHTEVDGQAFEWAEGDLVVVDHWCWHQHFNDDKENSSRLIRVHNFDSLYDLMQILLDPLVLIEEDPELIAPDLTGFEWPDPMVGRPAF